MVSKYFRTFCLHLFGKVYILLLRMATMSSNSLIINLLLPWCYSILAVYCTLHSSHIHLCGLMFFNVDYLMCYCGQSHAPYITIRNLANNLITSCPDRILEGSFPLSIKHWSNDVYYLFHCEVGITDPLMICFS